LAASASGTLAQPDIMNGASEASARAARERRKYDMNVVSP
jgi:hypothetical protein